ncbi:MAG TPA: hypothetical protein VGR37_19885 [Longimicrobiaceae bacterium]|nr:hypothetical protein [Longimicrobiaceae bacterium]
MTAALLAGLFAVPALLLWLGHRLRRRTARSRTIFWGAVVGHSVGILVTLLAAHYPPVPWEGGWRAFAVHASMLAGAALGAAAGAARGSHREPASRT